MSDAPRLRILVIGASGELGRAVVAELGARHEIKMLAIRQDAPAALAALAEASLVKHDPFEDGAPAVTVHRLVQAVARARFERKGAASSAPTRLIARLAAIYPSDGYSHPTSSDADLSPSTTSTYRPPSTTWST